MIHNKFYGQVSRTNDLLKFLTHEASGYSAKNNVCLKYDASIDDSKLQASAGVEVECPDCKCKSVAHDSYTVASLPVPRKNRLFEFTWIGEDVGIR